MIALSFISEQTTFNLHVNHQVHWWRYAAYIDSGACCIQHLIYFLFERPDQAVPRSSRSIRSMYMVRVFWPPNHPQIKVPSSLATSPPYTVDSFPSQVFSSEPCDGFVRFVVKTGRILFLHIVLDCTQCLSVGSFACYRTIIYGLGPTFCMAIAPQPFRLHLWVIHNALNMMQRLDLCAGETVLLR